MSDDLIKRQNVIESIWSIFNNTYNDASRFEAEETELARKVLVDVQRMIESQPTAYDVDKVVERLEDMRLKREEQLRTCADNDMADYFRCKMSAIAEVIEIVKSGGIE